MKYTVLDVGGSSIKYALMDDTYTLLQKDTIMAYQASKRGGMLYCTPQDDERISICGKAVLIAISEIFASLV